MIRTIALLFAGALVAAAATKEPEVLKLSGDVEGVHDPVIIKQKDTYYVFCTGGGCGGARGVIPIRSRGVNSTYNVVAGCSRRITGPYLDKDGKPLTEGGGTLVIAATTPNWRGSGHEAVLQEPGQDYLIFHAYHGTTGRSFLQISTMIWENGWPHVGALP